MLQSKISILILTGGKSSRYKTKSLLKYNNTSFIRHITNQFKQFKIYYSLDSKDSLYKLDNIETSNIIYDKKNNVLCAMYEAFQEIDSEYIFICSTDIVLITTELINTVILQALLNETTIIVKDKDNLHPLFSVYKKSEVLDVIKKQVYNEQYTVMVFLKLINYKLYDVTNTKFNNLLLNVNTKEDYKKIIEPFIFCVSGFKNSGKTTLINKLIQLLIKDYKVAVIKHDGHDYELNTVDTDTNKFIKTGAHSVTIYSEDKNTITTTSKLNIDEYIKSLNKYDIIIIEGLKDSDYKKISINNEFSNTFLKINKNYEIDEVYNKVIEEYNARF